MKRRITTSDIARAAGLHQTTVSLALRNDKRLRPETISRIKAVAAQLGYMPDPMLTALASYRRARRPSSQHGTLAWITNWPTREGWRSRPVFVDFFTGAQRRATELGYRLEEFWLNSPGFTPRRWSEVLYARGVQGLVLAPQPDGVSSVELDWAHFSAVTIGPTLRRPEIHVVSNNQYRTIARLCETLAARGYRRIGYSVERKIDERLDGQWSAAFDRFQRDLPSARRTVRHEEAPTAAGLNRWLRANRPDVVFGCADALPELLRRYSAGRARPVDFALVGTAHPVLGCQGMLEDAEKVGATAVERVTAMIHLGERGIPAIASRTLLNAKWVDAGQKTISADVSMPHSA